MKWVLENAESGDMIRIRLGDIYHYGIYVSDDEIIQFGLPPVNSEMLSKTDVSVCSTDIDSFRCGKFPEVAKLSLLEKFKRYPPEKTVAVARGRLGEKGYNLIHNNCEHFAYECVFGKKYCAQTEDVRQKFHSVPITDIYLSVIPEDLKITRLSCADRNAEIEKCSNLKVKIQKYYVWKLLEASLQYSLGLSSDKIDFTRSESGKWGCRECEFSMSHSGKVVAVIVSRAPVGIDVEEVKDNPKVALMANKILTDEEILYFNEADDKLKNKIFYGFWSAKESIFKKSGGKYFNPIKTDVTHADNLKVGLFGADNREYVLSYSASAVAHERFHLWKDGEMSPFKGITSYLTLKK